MRRADVNCPSAFTTCCSQTASRNRRGFLMADATAIPAHPLALPPLRPEYLREVVAGKDIGVIEQPLTLWQRLANQGWVGKTLTLFVIESGWEIYARCLNNPLLVPTFSATLEAFDTGMTNGELPEKVANSVVLLLKGYALGLALAMAFTALAIMSRIGN